MTNQKSQKDISYLARNSFIKKIHRCAGNHSVSPLNMDKIKLNTIEFALKFAHKIEASKQWHTQSEVNKYHKVANEISSEFKRIFKDTQKDPKVADQKAIMNLNARINKIAKEEEFSFTSHSIK